jgi:hypothetical protein
MSTEHGTKLQSRAALMRGAAVALACMLVAVGWAANRSAKQGPGQQGPDSARAADASARQVARASATVTPAPAATEWRYDTVVKRNLFMPPAGHAPQQPPALPPLAPMPIDAFTQVGMDGAGSEAALESQPQWIYAGYATIGGKPMAIVENSGTKVAEFLQVGQTLDDFVVTEVKPEALQLTRDGETKTLPISDAFTATPLNEPPQPARDSTRDRGGRWRGGFPGGGFPGGGFPGSGDRGDFFRRVLPALRDNPEFADQARRFLDNLAGPGQAGGPSSAAPASGGRAEGGTP